MIRYLHTQLVLRHNLCLVLVRSLVGFVLYGTGYSTTKAIVYLNYVRPIRHEEQQVLESELLEAETIAGVPSK